MSDNVTVLPLSRAEVEVERHRQWGDFLVELTITGAELLPTKGGTGNYRPRKVLLRWATKDGIEWTFQHAVLVGPNELYGHLDSSITIYLGDKGYPDCEPSWLAGLVARYAPGGDY